MNLQEYLPKIVLIILMTAFSYFMLNNIVMLIFAKDILGFMFNEVVASIIRGIIWCVYYLFMLIFFLGVYMTYKSK